MSNIKKGVGKLKEIEKLRKELHLVKPKNGDNYVFDLNNDTKNVESFRNFVKKFELVEFKYNDSLFLKKRFNGLGAVSGLFNSPFWIFDHMRLARNKDNDYILILQPYYTDEECIEDLKALGIKSRYEVLGKSASYHANGSTNLVVIYEDSYGKR